MSNDFTVSELKEIKSHPVIRELKSKQNRTGELTFEEVASVLKSENFSARQTELACAVLFYSDITKGTQNQDSLSWEKENPAGGTIATYIQDIAKIPRINPEDEIRLGTLIQKGIAAQSELDDPESVLSEEEKAKLQKDIKTGETAKAKLVESNLKLVVSVAKRYGRDRVSMNLQDCIQEGNLGLIKAAEKFDPTLGNRFSTYATWWIHQKIRRGIIDKDRFVRVPVPASYDWGKIVDLHRVYQEEHNRPPVLSELVEATGFSQEKILTLQKASYQPSSLEFILTDGSDKTLGVFLEDTEIPSPEQEVERLDLQEKVWASIKNRLSEREAYVITCTFGLGNSIPKTLQQVGDELGLSKERIRQIQDKSLRKLQHPVVARELKPLLA